MGMRWSFSRRQGGWRKRAVGSHPYSQSGVYIVEGDYGTHRRRVKWWREGVGWERAKYFNLFPYGQSWNQKVGFLEP